MLYDDLVSLSPERISDFFRDCDRPMTSGATTSPDLHRGRIIAVLPCSMASSCLLVDLLHDLPCPRLSYDVIPHVWLDPKPLRTLLFRIMYSSRIHDLRYRQSWRTLLVVPEGHQLYGHTVPLPFPVPNLQFPYGVSELCYGLGLLFDHILEHH